MKYGYKNKYDASYEETESKFIMVPIDHLYVHVHQNAEVVSQKLLNQELPSTFGKVAKRDTVSSDMGVLGNVFFDVFMWGSIASAFSGAVNGVGIGFQESISNMGNGSFPVIADGLAMAIDEKHDNRRQKVVCSRYPKGRRQLKMLFNPHSLSDIRTVPRHTVYASNELDFEMAQLNHILEMLEDLMKRDVTEIQLDKEETIFDTVSRLHDHLYSKDVSFSWNSGVKMAAV